MKVSLLCITLSALFALNCRTITTAPPSTGSIAGRVILYDSNQRVMTDYSGIRVSIDGTSKSMVTDSTGSWLFSDLPAGMFDVTASKQGYGAYHWYQQNVSNGRIYGQTAALASLPNFAPNPPIVSSFHKGDDALGVTVDGGNLTPYLGIACYVDTDSNVRPSDPHMMITWSLSPHVTMVTFMYANLLAAGVRPGQTLYISTALVFTYNTGIVNSIFVDPAHNNQMRCASNGQKSNVVAVTMP